MFKGENEEDDEENDTISAWTFRKRTGYGKFKKKISKIPKKKKEFQRE